MPFLLTLFAGLLGLAAPRSEAAAPAVRPATVQVRVDVRCRGEGVQISVDPWGAMLSQGDSLDWVLNPNANAGEFTITAKQPGWPFVQSPPYRGDRGNPARGRGMKPNQSGQRYRYAIEMVCQTEGSGPHRVVVDPDVIIR